MFKSYTQLSKYRRFYKIYFFITSMEEENQTPVESEESTETVEKAEEEEKVEESEEAKDAE